MRRESLPARPDWRERVETLGFDFHTLDGLPYWVEGACYRFTAHEIDRFEAVGNELHAMCLELVSEVIQAGRYDEFGLDARAAGLVEASWNAREPALYGRFDLAYDGYGEPKLLEYNADTPTSLFEASVVQWYWLEDTRAGADQFNLLHEALVERWKTVTAAGPVHFSGCLDEIEDRITVEYLRETCLQAGLQTQVLDVSSIGFDGRDFIDLADRPIVQMFKLYPWEWMMGEEFAALLPRTRCRWIEPAWKMLLSNKSLLPALWRRFPAHPNLLPASHRAEDLGGEVIAKPRFGREGEGVFLMEQARAGATGPLVYQARAPLFASRHGHALLGLWVVGDSAVGLGVREDDTPITRNTSRFIPHCFD